MANNKAYYKGQPKRENSIGYCHYSQHLGYVNDNIIKKHQCLEKQCKYLERYEDNIYWCRREIRKYLKQINKNNGGYLEINGVLYLTHDLNDLTMIYWWEYQKNSEKPTVLIK